MSKQTFLTICPYCGKRIAVLVSSDKLCHGAYSCNKCIPKFSSARNGIDEAIETDLYDEINDKLYERIKTKYQ